MEGRTFHGTGAPDAAVDRIELATPAVECGNNASENGSAITGVSAAGSRPNCVVGTALVASAGIVPVGGASVGDVVLDGIIDASGGGSDDKADVLSRNELDVIPGIDTMDVDMVGAGTADDDTAGDSGRVAHGLDVRRESVLFGSTSFENSLYPVVKGSLARRVNVASSGRLAGG